MPTKSLSFPKGGNMCWSHIYKYNSYNIILNIPIQSLQNVHLYLPFPQGGNMGQGNYAASKAGVEAFSKTAAKELAR